MNLRIAFSVVVAAAFLCQKATAATYLLLSQTNNFANQIIAASNSNWVKSGTTNATLAGVATAGGFALDGETIAEWLWTTNRGSLDPNPTIPTLPIARIKLPMSLGNAGFLFEDPGYYSANNGLSTNAFGWIGQGDYDTSSTNGSLVFYGERNAPGGSPISFLGAWADVAYDDPVIGFNAFTPSADALAQKTMFGFYNDGKIAQNGRYAVQIYESHGTFAGGYPDQVAFLGVNTVSPVSPLHVINPPNTNGDDPKTNVVATIEGRADQTGDLAQWKLTGGPVLASVSKDGTIIAPAFVMSGSSVKTDTTSGHTGTFQAYDNDDAQYRTFATLLNGNTPSLTIAPPTGGTVTLQGLLKAADGTSGITTNITAGLVTFTIKNGLIVGVSL